MIIFFGIGVFKIFSNAQANFKVSDTIKKSDVVELTSNNYTNILKTVHEDIDSYVGTKVHFVGFVYRVFDFTETQFVLGRNMIISSDYQAVVVGFLCNYRDAKDFADNTWVEITGTITKGNYNGDMPIVEIEEIKQTETPADEFVYPPDESYVPTSGLL